MKPLPFHSPLLDRQRLPIPGDHDHRVAALVKTVIAIGVGLGLVYGLIGALT